MKRKPKFSDYKFILEFGYYTVYLNLFGRDVPQWTFSCEQYESGYAEKYVREFMPKRKIFGLDENI